MPVIQSTLIGDNIENPGNAQTMLHGAKMLGCNCLFRDRKGLAQAWQETMSEGHDFQYISLEQIATSYSSVVAFDNIAGATNVYGFRPAKKDTPLAMVVGNERLGLTKDIQAIAQYTVQIPLVSPKINSLNVAAASAVGLYYLLRGGGHKLQLKGNPNKKRPELLLLGAADHIELGSTIRSACAFGWQRAFVEDRFGVWFGCDRITRSEGRGAARRGRNPIRLIPAAPDSRYTFNDVTVITSKKVGKPLFEANLARGPQQLIIIPDESRVDLEAETWHRFGQNINFVHLDLPVTNFVYHYRLIATIALAEIARQVGQRPYPVMDKPKRQRLVYDKSLSLDLEARGELVFLEDLECY